MTTLSPTALEEAAKALDELPLSDGDRFGTLIYMSDYVHPGSRDDMRCASLKILNAVATAAITAYLAQREKEGFVMVPKEPTKEMIYDGNTTIDDCIDFWNYDSGSGYCVEPHAAAACYRAMLTAASQEQNDD